MAEMIPEKMPATSTAGEKRLFNILAKLPDDCLVYYEPVVRRRYPDFIVVLPTLGVLVFEVKDWRLGELTAVTPDRLILTRRGMATSVPHPYRQARGYMLRLMDECRRHPRAHLLMHRDGAYANRYIFPFCYVAVLGNINHHQLEDRSEEFAQVFPAGALVTRDVLGAWEQRAGDDLLATLKPHFEPWWDFARLSSEQIDVFRSLIHPEIVIHRDEAALAVLDLRQERNARALADGHRIVYGVAGSGKTVLLVARARLLAEDPGKQVLLLCHNRLLASSLAAALSDHANVTVKTFHAWGHRNGAEFRDDEDDDAFGERLFLGLQQSARDAGRFDAVLIDEAQDWPCSWFRCAKLALREAETGDLLIVGDGNQSLYRKRDFTWADAGIHALGRTINKRFDLARNYRNTAEILNAARPFAVQRPPGTPPARSDLLTLAIDPDMALRNGPEPQIVKLDDPSSECHYAAALIETWLRGGVDICGRRERLQPRDIAVLYPQKRHDASIDTLYRRLGGFTQAVLLTRDRPADTLRQNAVRILSIHSSRGLQFRVVIVLWADHLPSGFRGRDEAAERGLLFVAMTRAEDMLVVLHSGSSPYVEELYRALKTAQSE